MNKRGDFLLAVGSPFGVLSPMHFFNRYIYVCIFVWIKEKKYLAVTSKMVKLFLLVHCHFISCCFLELLGLPMC